MLVKSFRFASLSTNLWPVRVKISLIGELRSPVHLLNYIFHFTTQNSKKHILAYRGLHLTIGPLFHLSIKASQFYQGNKGELYLTIYVSPSKTAYWNFTMQTWSYRYICLRCFSCLSRMAKIEFDLECKVKFIMIFYSKCLTVWCFQVLVVKAVTSLVVLLFPDYWSLSVNESHMWPAFIMYMRKL